MRSHSEYLTAFLLSLLIVNFSPLIHAQELDPDPNYTYFLVTPHEERDSYVLPLIEESDIARARAIIEMNGSGCSTIVVARIEEGHGNCNRDLINGRIWSWHVSEFLGFADMTAEVLDGTPTWVEEDLDYWLSLGMIGFWSYTASRELTLKEVRSGVLGP